jgi:predicted Zn finger-like uncharacterized protein
MLIVCPSCGTSYDVKSASMPPAGRQVRCLRCRTVWHAEPSRADKVLAAAAAIGPDRSVAGEASCLVAERAASQVASDSLASAAGDNTQPAEDEPFASATTGEGGPEGFPDEPDDAAEVQAPPIAPNDFEGRPPIDVDDDDHADRRATLPEDIETVAARRQRRSAARTALRWPLSLLQTGVLALVLVDVILIGWRYDVVRVLPQTASFYALLGMPVNLRGLTFDGIATSTEQHEGVPILVVEGNVINTARKAVDVPRLKFIVRNAARQEIYSWTAVPSHTSLPPGDAVPFRTRLASPPPDARDVIVRFVNRRDIVAGAR